jgi:hypothetical protein
MPRRRAEITQADVARAVRAARQAGAKTVEIKVGQSAVITIRLEPSTAPDPAPEESGEIVL